MTSTALIEEISRCDPQWGRRLSPELSPEVLSRLLEWLRRKKHRKPPVAFINAIAAGEWQCREHSIETVDLNAGGVEMEPLSPEQLGDRIERILRECMPEDQVGVAARVKRQRAAKSRDRRVQFRKGHRPAPGNQTKNRALHGADDAHPAHEGQDGKEAARRAKITAAQQPTPASAA